MLPLVGLLALTFATTPVSEGPKPLQPAKPLDNKGKLLLCHPKVLGRVSPKRVEDFLAASRKYKDRFFDYGNLCESAAEASRVAADLRLRYGIMTTAAEEPTGSRYVLHLTEAKTERIVKKTELLLPNGADVVKPLELAMGEMIDATYEGRPVKWGAVATMGVGVAALAVGTVFALAGRSASEDGAKATTAEEVLDAKQRFDKSRKLSVGFFIGGGAAVAGGFAWQFVF